MPPSDPAQPQPPSDRDAPPASEAPTPDPDTESETNTDKPKKRGGLGCLVPFLVLVLIVVAGRGHLLPGFGGGKSAPIGGPFALVNEAGETVTDRDFLGRYRLMYFGYTYCPDICPTSLSTMAQALETLDPAKAEQIVPIFVTIDPVRDTPEVVGEYARAFHPSIIGLSGDAAQIAPVAEAFKVKYERVEAEGAGPYLIDHTALTYFMAPTGQYLTYFAHGTPPETMAEGIDKAMAIYEKAVARAAERAARETPRDGDATETAPNTAPDAAPDAATQSGS